MKRKVLYIIQSLGIGGAEVALLSAIHSLNKNYDFKLICLKTPDDEFTRNLTEKEKENIIVFNIIPSNYFLALLYILKFKPDIVISSLWKAAILGILAKFANPKIKFVQFIHSTTFFHFCDKWFSIWALKKSDIVFCDSVSAKVFANKFIKSKPIEIISFLRFISPNELKPKEKIALKGIYIGRFHQLKRVDRLVFLVKEMVESGLNFEVDLYGRDDGALSSVKELIQKYKLEKNLVLKGEIESEKIEKLLTQYDFYFQTSDVEGMAMSVVEAMQQGLVSVVTNVGEIKNYAIHGENAIIISEPFDEKISEIVQQIKETTIDIDLYNKLARNAYLTFSNKVQFCDSLINEINRI